MNIDGPCSFVVHPIGGALRYDGRYTDGLRDGLWRVSKAETGAPCWEVTWVRGEWHGPSRSWYGNGQLEREGHYRHGQHVGLWTFWFQTGQVAARGGYDADRKAGAWKYWDIEGDRVPWDAWEEKYSTDDFAFDDCRGMPRGENWPHPPPEPHG